MKSISALKKALDKEFGRIVRARGMCAKCQKGAEEVGLQCAHIFSRKNMSVRWDFENALSLCWRCHFHWAHKEPIQFYEFVEEYLGVVRFAQLKFRAKQIKKWTRDELEELLEKMKELK